ncbi:MAG TPA: hypothetical protein PL187_17205, partial [Caldilinea sp.]|nr:hypothetical protein [Caldilinea sp.]
RIVATIKTRVVDSPRRATSPTYGIYQPDRVAAIFAHFHVRNEATQAIIRSLQLAPRHFQN